MFDDVSHDEHIPHEPSADVDAQPSGVEPELQNLVDQDQLTESSLIFKVHEVSNPHTQHNAPRKYTPEQEPSGPGHGTHSATHRACAPVNRSQVTQDTANATQRTEGVHR